MGTLFGCFSAVIRKCSLGALKNSAILTWNNLCWCLILIKLQALRPATLLKQGSNNLPVKSSKFLRTHFYTELLLAVSVTEEQANLLLGQQSTGSTTAWYYSLSSAKSPQGCSEGTSSVTFEVLIINCQICFINLFIFNCLTLNIKLFIFKLFDVKFLFSKNHVFRKQKRTAVYGVMDACP